MQLINPTNSCFSFLFQESSQDIAEKQPASEGPQQRQPAEDGPLQWTAAVTALLQTAPAFSLLGLQPLQATADSASLLNTAQPTPSAQQHEKH